MSEAKEENIEHSMHSVELKSFIDQNYGEVVKKRQGYVEHCHGDDLPQYFMELFLEAPFHGSLIKSIRDLIYGQGFLTANGDAPIGKVLDWLERKKFGKTGYDVINDFIFSLVLNGGVFPEILQSKDGMKAINIPKYKHVRCGIKNNDYEIEKFFFSTKFGETSYVRDKVAIEAYDKTKNQQRSIDFVHIPLDTNEYYPLPHYFQSLRHIETEREMAKFHLNNLLNGMFMSGVLNMGNGQPATEEEKKKIIRETKKEIAGSDNAGRFLINFHNGSDTKAEWQSFNGSGLHKQFEHLSKEMKDHILTAHRVTSGIIFGVRDNSGFGNNADEIALALAVYERNVIKHYRRLINTWFNSFFETHLGSKVEYELTSEPIEALTEGVEKRSELKSQKAKNADQIDFIKQLSKLKDDSKDTNDNYVLIDTEYVDEDVVEDDGTYLSNYEFLGNVKDKIIKLREMLAITSEPDYVSSHDRGFFRVRYLYDHPAPIETSRAFCVDMYENHRERLFRKEDIDQMSFRGENSEFGIYSIWRFKGSYGCRGKWKRCVFMLKRVPKGQEVEIDGTVYKAGQFLPTDRMSHYKKINPNKAKGVVPNKDQEAENVNP